MGWRQTGTVQVTYDPTVSGNCRLAATDATADPKDLWEEKWGKRREDAHTSYAICYCFRALLRILSIISLFSRPFIPRAYCDWG
jgi:hypothetical protein